MDMDSESGLSEIVEPNVQSPNTNTITKSLIGKFVTPVLKMIFLCLSVTMFALVITLIFRDFELEEHRIKNQPSPGPIVKLVLLGLLVTSVIFMVLLGAQADNSWMVDKVALLATFYCVYTACYIIFLPFSVLRIVVLIVGICLCVMAALLAVQLRKSNPNSWRPHADYLVLFA